MIPVDVGELYFTSADHRQNFMSSIEKFNCNNSEFMSACYIAAYPEIFKCFSLQQQDHGPFDWYFEHLFAADDPEANNTPKTGDTAPLTNQTTALVHLGLNLWNGVPLDLAHGLSIWDSELYEVALQAINLRRQRRFAIHE